MQSYNLLCYVLLDCASRSSLLLDSCADSAHRMCHHSLCDVLRLSDLDLASVRGCFKAQNEFNCSARHTSEPTNQGQAQAVHKRQCHAPFGCMTAAVTGSAPSVQHTDTISDIGEHAQRFQTAEHQCWNARHSHTMPMPLNVARKLVERAL
jgi:hypothetical protein